jgi:hypothetical protein
MKLNENTYTEYIRCKYKKKCNPYEILLFINMKSDNNYKEKWYPYVILLL